LPDETMVEEADRLMPEEMAAARASLGADVRGEAESDEPIPGGQDQATDAQADQWAERTASTMFPPGATPLVPTLSAVGLAQARMELARNGPKHLVFARPFINLIDSLQAKCDEAVRRAEDRERELRTVADIVAGCSDCCVKVYAVSMGAKEHIDELGRLRGEVERLTGELDEAQLRSIEARNPGINMEEVRRVRAGHPPLGEQE
jgi:hypothetical protein